MAELIIENRQRDSLDFGKLTDKDGNELGHIRLGSADDREGAPLIRDSNGTVLPGRAGEWNADFPNPAMRVDAKVWDAYLSDKARGPMIRELLEKRAISVNGAR